MLRSEVIKQNVKIRNNESIQKTFTLKELREELQSIATWFEEEDGATQVILPNDLDDKLLKLFEVTR